MKKLFPDGLGRKFFITVYCLMVITLALFTGILDGGTFVAGLTVVLGFFGATNQIEKSQIEKRVKS